MIFNLDTEDVHKIYCGSALKSRGRTTWWEKVLNGNILYHNNVKFFNNNLRNFQNFQGKTT